jgi:hypothetical protein
MTPLCKKAQIQAGGVFASDFADKRMISILDPLFLNSATQF